jgi:phosphonate transport system permease protein
MNESPAAERALATLEAQQRRWGFRRFRTWTVVVAIVAFYIVSWQLAQVDPAKLAIGLPKLGHWIATAWPPAVGELPLFLQRTAETVAMAAIGTTVATLLAIPMAVLVLPRALVSQCVARH